MISRTNTVALNVSRRVAETQRDFFLEIIHTLIIQQFLKRFLIVLIIFIFAMCNGCTSLKPPLELAPNRDIITKALFKQLHQTHHYLSSNLKSSSPQLEITEINVSQIEPYFRENLPIYHLKGTYQLNLQLSKKQVQQQSKKFDLYLQRQKEGKTWHLIDQKNRHNFSIWLSDKNY